ncbi:MAG: sigma-70 family RNA polymerase sigma factor [Coriobacteriales bacterium]|nr:sigma-70 family RNA polymerase sigma factor [Coriobacteriales bacterium]
MSRLFVLLLAFDTRTERTTRTERDAFEYLYHKYKDLLFYKSWEILHDYMLAEDAVSEAFIRIFRNLDKIEDVDSPRTAAFVVTIARNCALTLLGKANRESAEEALEETADPLDIETTVLDALAAEEVYALLDRLDEQLRDIFVLKYAYDLPHREIAAQLGITENNVTVKLHRAKKKLSELMSGRS